MEKNVKAAISAAVFTYITSQEAAFSGDAGQAAGIDAAEQPPAAASAFNAWGYAGRQAQMQQRAMMQMRAFK